MDNGALEKLTGSEEQSRAYLLGLCWPDGRRFCPRCRNPRTYELNDGRLRCPSCRYTFHDLSGRWVNVGGLTCRQWLRLIALFEQELTVNRMAPELGLAYNTAYKAVTALRFSILAQALDARQLLSGAFGRDMGFEAGRIVMEKPGERQGSFPVFGFLERQGWAFVDLLPNLTADDVLHFHVNFKLRLARMGNLVYTDPYRHYDTLLVCGDHSLPFRFVPEDERHTHVDVLEGGFWAFARERLRRFNGVSPRRFPLYLKELEFRYNHASEPLFPLLCQGLCGFVPNCE